MKLRYLALMGLLITACGGHIPPQPPPTPPPPTPPPQFHMTPLTVSGTHFVPEIQGATRTACGWPFVLDPCLQQLADRKLNWVHFRLPFVTTDDPARQAYVLVNGKSDLTQWNEPFFTWLDQLYTTAENRGIYIEQDLIDGWWLKHTDIPGHSWRKGNNVNGVDLGYCGDTQSQPHGTALAYVRKIASIAAKHGNVHAQDGNEIVFCNPSAAWISGLRAAWDDEIAKDSNGGKRLFGTNSQRVELEPLADYASYHQEVPPPARNYPTQINETFPLAIPQHIKLIRDCRKLGRYCHGWSDDEPGIGGWPEDEREWLQLLDRIRDLKDHPCAFPLNTDSCVTPVPPSQTLGTYAAAVAAVQAAHPDWFVDGKLVHGIDPEPVGRIYRQQFSFAIADELLKKGYCTGVTEPGLEITNDGVWIDEYAPVQQTDGAVRPAANAYRNHCKQQGALAPTASRTMLEMFGLCENQLGDTGYFGGCPSR